MKKSPLRNLFMAFVGLLSLVLPASATWSIVVVNRITGEVGVACATCIANFDLERAVPMIVVGKGAAAAQSFIDMTGANRQFIFQELKKTNADPQTILDALAVMDMGHQTRQYGILSLNGGGPVTFTGNRAGSAASGVVGQVGDYVYAIQGNVLTADAVVLAAESAFVSTNGDMGQRLMAGMQAARALGGDGRCSCSNAAPTSCGAPPPGFTKSAHTGFIIVARQGNIDGKCNAQRGCSTGVYYLDLNVRGAASSVGSPDPVIELQRRYDGWRKARLGRPDGVNFSLQGVDALPADGLSQRNFTVHLADIDGTPLTAGGASLTLRHLNPSTAIATIGPVVDNGDGSYTFSVTAGTSVGTDQIVIKADDGFVRPELFPYVTIRSEAVSALHQGYDSVSVADGNASLPLQLNLPGLDTRSTGGRYVMMASMSGTSPGTHVGMGFLPLNEPLVFLQMGHPVKRLTDASIGSLDAAGRALEVVDFDVSVLMRLMGQRIDFSALYLDGGELKATNAAGVQILP